MHGATHILHLHGSVRLDESDVYHATGPQETVEISVTCLDDHFPWPHAPLLKTHRWDAAFSVPVTTQVELVMSGALITL